MSWHTLAESERGFWHFVLNERRMVAVCGYNFSHKRPVGSAAELRGAMRACPACLAYTQEAERTS